MAASANPMIGQPRRVPRITPETREEMRQRDFQAIRTPELESKPAPLRRTERYVFRTKPRTCRGLVHYINVRPDGLDETDPKERMRLRRWDFWQKKEIAKYGDDWPNLVQRVYEEIGGHTIAFHPINKKFECFFATDSDDVATYIRHFMKHGIGEFKWVYEQNPRAKWVVRDDNVAKAFPNTDTGARMAQEYMLSLGKDAVMQLLPDDDDMPTAPVVATIEVVEYELPNLEGIPEE